MTSMLEISDCVAQAMRLPRKEQSRQLKTELALGFIRARYSFLW